MKNLARWTFLMLGLGTVAVAQAGPGEDTILLTRPVQIQGSPFAQTARSTPLQTQADMPAWLRAKVSRYEAKAFASPGDGSIFTEKDVVTSSKSNGIARTCIQSVGSNTSASPTTLANGNQQIVVLRGDLVNVCR